MISNLAKKRRPVKILRFGNLLPLMVLGCLIFQGHGLAAKAESVMVSAKVEAVQAAYELLEKGWVDAAIEAFDAAVKQSPESVNAQLGLAIAYQRRGKNQAAWHQYQRVLQLQPNQLDALQAVGTMASYRPEWQRQGITALTQLLEQQPQNWTAQRQRALLNFYQGQLDDALVDYERVLAGENAVRQLTGEDLLGAAQVLTYRDRPTQALILFERYQQQSGEIPDAPAIAYVQALYKTGRADQAIGLLSELLKGAQAGPNESAAGPEPLNLQLKQELIQAHLANQQPDIALGIYDDLVGQFPEKLPLRVRQLALAQNLERLCSADVLESLRSHFTQIPETPQQQKELAQALVSLEPHTEFLDLYQALMKTEVDAPFLHFRIAQMQSDQGDFDQARQSLERYTAANTAANTAENTAIKAAIKAGDADFTADLFQAELYRRQEQFAQSQATYQAILNQDPNNVPAQAGLGGLALQQQEIELAQQRFRQVLKDDPKHIMARASLAEIKAAQGQPITALRELEQLAQGPCRHDERCDLKRRSQQIRQRLHRQRGFQPPWERY